MHYNAGAFVSAGEACLIDPGILLDEIEALVRELDGAELRSIVLTHADWDHVLGPEHLPRATIVAHAEYARDLDPDGIRVALGQLEQQAGVTREQAFEPPLPDETFEDGDDVAGRRPRAPAHACSGSLGGTLVVGHGTPTDDEREIRRRLAEDRAYLADLRASVTEAVAAGRSLDDTVASCGRIALRRSEEDDGLHRLNVEKVYADRGGDADPEQVGYARVWKAGSRYRTQMLFTRKKTALPSPEEALPGRDTPIAELGRHLVLGTPLMPPFPDATERIVVGMGCFWGAERMFWQAPSIYTTAVGYAGGLTPNPTYQEVCSGRTGHTEVVLAVFDPKQTSYEEMLRIFWEGHDPTQGMQQGNDVGTQYRSAIYWTTDAQREAALSSRDRFQAELTRAGYGEITTEIAEAGQFFYAEDYHQQYLEANPNGYCGLGGTGVSCPVGTGVEAAG